MSPEQITDAMEAHHNRLQGYFNLLEDRNQKVVAWVSKIGRHMECSSTSKCKQVSRDLTKMVLSSTAGKPESFVTMFRSWWVMEKEYKILEGLCKACSKESEQAHDSAREKMWKNLPLHFGLKAWEELKDG